MMPRNTILAGLIAAQLFAGCATPSSSQRGDAPAVHDTAANPLLKEQFVFDVLQHVYRWHFDQSFLLGTEKVEAMEVWARPLHPRLDPGDKSEFAELWIPAVQTRVELKRSDYKIAEVNLDIVDSAFKIKRVSRQATAPASRASYQVGRYPLGEVRERLFTTRANHALLNDNLRTVARKLAAEYLKKAHPEPFTEEQVLHLAPVSPVCNDFWIFWETGRKIMMFSADMDLANPGFSEVSQLRLEVINLDTDVVASTNEVPGSNAFVTKDWVGRLFFNCILYGERLTRTAEQMNRLRTDPTAQP